MTKAKLTEILEEFLFYYDTNRHLSNKDGALQLSDQLTKLGLLKTEKEKFINNQTDLALKCVQDL